MRRAVQFLAALTALVASITATLATAQEHARLARGFVDATRTSDLPYIQPRLGVNVSLEQYSEDELAVQLRQISEAGFTWVRQEFPWNEIEPAPGSHDWELWDRIVEAIAREDLRPVAVLLNAPLHASGSADPSAPPAQPGDFGDFAARLASRYGETIDHYQIWDEPNLKDAWGQLDPAPVNYLAMLREAWRAIHDADPTATVIAAALAPTTERGPRNISDIDYLASLYALGASAWMDAVAGKPYGFDASPDDRFVSNDRLNFSRIVALRELMTSNGDGHKALWASAMGWNSLPRDWTGRPSIWGQVTAARRSDWTLAALERARREWPWLGGMILQHWQPDVPADHPFQGFALADASNQPAPLLTALAQRRPEVAAGPGLHAVNSPWASYSGTWSFAGDGADFGWDNDSELQFDFHGEEIALLVREGDFVAWFFVTVNGEPANALPQDAAGNAYLNLTSASRKPETRRVHIARNLGPGPHRLVARGVDLVKVERQPRWALAGFAVGTGDMARRSERQILAGSFASLFSAVALLTALPVRRWRNLAGRIRGFLRPIDPGMEQLLGVLASLVLMVGMLLTWSEAVPAIFRRDALQPVLALLTAGLIFLQPALLVTILALLLLFILIFRNPALGLMLTLLWAPFYLFPLQLFHFAFPLAEVMILLTTAAWLLRRALEWARRSRQQESRPRHSFAGPAFNALDLLMLAWLGVGLLSYSWSVWQQPAMTELRVLFVEPSLFYLIFRHEVRKQGTRILLADSLLAAGLIVSVIGLWLYFRGEGVITAEGGVHRLVSVYGSPNNAALFLGRCLPFALAWVLPGTRGLRRWLALAVFLIGLLALLLTQSAGALMLGLPLSLAALVLLHWRRRALAPLAALAAAGAASLALLTGSSPRFARLLDLTSGTVRIRLQLWESTIAMLRDSPLRGLGLDQFLYAYRDTWILPNAWREPNLSHPHNIIMDFWIRLGLAGPLLLIALLVVFWRTALQAFRRVASQSSRVLLAGAMGSMVSLLGHGLVDNSIYVHDLAYVFVFLTALVANISEDDVATE